MTPDLFRPDAALIPLMSEDMLLAFDLHPTLELVPLFYAGCMPGKVFTTWSAMPRWDLPYAAPEHYAAPMPKPRGFYLDRAAK